MRKSEAKEIARNILQDLIALAGYKLYEGEEYENYSEDEKDLINQYLKREGSRACKTIKREFYTM